jgi:hypothetical protein
MTLPFGPKFFWWSLQFPQEIFTATIILHAENYLLSLESTLCEANACLKDSSTALPSSNMSIMNSSACTNTAHMEDRLLDDDFFFFDFKDGGSAGDCVGVLE